ncbi:MAG: hypothetical protein L3J39_15270, partial [Verrucomicrobiales bacterium]|nr:hypothetical protein [Verrucomicrobiales bacterium]
MDAETRCLPFSQREKFFSPIQRIRQRSRQQKRFSQEHSTTNVEQLSKLSSPYSNSLQSRFTSSTHPASNPIPNP